MPDLPPEDEIICQCHQVNEKTIRAKIAEKNITKVEQVTKACEAGGGCHSCHILIELFIDQHQAKVQLFLPEVSSENQQEGILRRIFRRFRPSESTG